MRKLCTLFLTLMSVAAMTMAAEVTRYSVGNVFAQYYNEDHDWWIELSIPGQDGNALCVFNYDVVAPASGLEAGKVYTHANLLKGAGNYNFMQDYEGEYRYTDADIMVEYDAVNNFKYILAHATLEDGRQYELSYVAPTIVAKDTIALNLPNARFDDYTAGSGQLRFRGWDESMHYNLYITLLTSQITGEYTWLDIDKPFTSLYLYTPASTPDEDGDLMSIPLVNGTIQVSNAEGGYRVDAYLLGLDEHCYHAVMFCPVPTKQQEVTISSDDMTLNASAWENEGYFYFVAADDNYEVYLSIFPRDYQDIVGSYSQHDLELNYSLVYDFQQDSKYEIYAADLHVTQNEQLEYVITGTLLCFNGVEYTLNLRRTEKLDYDTDEPFEAAYARGETQLIDHYLQNYGVLSLLSVKANNNATFVEFHVDYEHDMREHYEATGEYLIPEGVYPIDLSGAAGTISASLGVTMEPMPSYCVLIEGSQQMTETLWFMVAGEAKVTRVDGVTHVEIEAQNSYCQRIHVNIDGVENYDEGVENCEMEQSGAKKYLMDGQLFIERAGEKYNVMGITTK